jgi:hypothetical protein
MYWQLLIPCHQEIRFGTNDGSARQKRTFELGQLLDPQRTLSGLLAIGLGRYNAEA